MSSKPRITKDIEDPCPFGPEMQGLWNARYRLFSKFDQVRVSAACLYTITPEVPALEIAHTLPGQNVLDICSGAGAMAIAFARAGKKVTSIDVSADRITEATHNAAVYDVSDGVTFVQSDAMAYVTCPEVRQKKFDIVFIDAPWGSGFGDYRKKPFIPLEGLALGGIDLRDIVRGIDCEMVGLKLPYNFCYESIVSGDDQTWLNYGFDTNADDAGYWLYSMVAMPKQQFLAIPRYDAETNTFEGPR